VTFLTVFLIVISFGLLADSWWDRRVIKKLNRRLDALEQLENAGNKSPALDFRTWGPEHKKVEGETYDPPPVDMYEETKSDVYKKE
jgi:hypothetical protein